MRTGTTDLKPCPFCGGSKDSHEDWCFILMCLVNEEQAMFGNKRLFTEEELSNAWNTRAERTCKNVTNGEMFECSECDMTLYLRNEEAGYLNYENGDILYCPACGARVTGD